jgi:Zn finger protein HypA/HybF involved in hydrogenase expression
MKTISLEKLSKAVKNSTSYLQTGLKLGVSRYVAKDRIHAAKLDISHFRRGRGRFYAESDIFTEGSKATRTCLKRTVLRLSLIEEKCACGLTNEWNGSTLVLELDHIDGDSTNNTVGNLRFMCPNCHSQTETNKGKNKKLNRMRRK